MLRRNIKHEKCRYHYFYDYFITQENPSEGKEMSKYHNNTESDPRIEMEMRGIDAGVSDPTPSALRKNASYFPERRRQKIV